ncbi:MAG: RluA family pseudouridine synthase [Sedimentisphaerales bacterium]|nr:RluA family pseudouridine synthase [Sedimentisphaerales bacterium]
MTDLPDNLDPATDETNLSAEVEAEDDVAEHVYLTIKRQLPNPRLDKYLHHRFPDFSRNIIQRLIKEQAVTINGKPTKSSYQLKLHDRIDILLPPREPDTIEPEKMYLDILYEDDHILAVNKPAYIVVHPARGNKGGTLVNGLAWYSNSLSTVNQNFRPGIVHRLDRNTTGVMVIAKTDTAHWRLAHQFEHRQTAKQYLAFVQGTMEFQSDVIDMPLGRHPKVREKYAIQPNSGKEAVTLYEVVKQFRGYALVRLKPKTGRTHQLRVHLSAIKHPIVADLMYGGKYVTLAQLADGAPLPMQDEPGGDLLPDQIVIDRQALHAAVLELRHPISAQPIRFEAPLPPDMQRLLHLLEKYRNT